MGLVGLHHQAIPRHPHTHKHPRLHIHLPSNSTTVMVYFIYSVFLSALSQHLTKTYTYTTGSPTIPSNPPNLNTQSSNNPTVAQSPTSPYSNQSATPATFHQLIPNNDYVCLFMEPFVVLLCGVILFRLAPDNIYFLVCFLWQHAYVVCIFSIETLYIFPLCFCWKYACCHGKRTKKYILCGASLKRITPHKSRTNGSTNKHI